MQASDVATPAVGVRRVLGSLPWAGLMLIAVSYGLARFAYGLFVPVFRAEFGLSAGTVGAISSASYAAYCLAVVLSTLATPKWGARAVAVLAGVTATSGTLMVALAPTVSVLAVAVVIAGSSAGLASSPLAHAVAHSVASASRDRAQAFINSGTGAGVIAAGPVALLVQDQWRWAWVAFALACLVSTLWVAVAVPARDQELRDSEGGAPRLLPSPVFPSGSARLTVAALTLGASSAAMWTFGRDLMVSEGQMSEFTSTVAWVILGAFGLLGAYAGALTGRFGVRRAWLLMLLAVSGSLALMAATPAWVVGAWVATAAFGASYIAATGLLLIWATRLHPTGPAAGVGMAFLLVAVGQSIGAPVVGLLWESYGAQAAFFAAALLAAGGALARPVRDRA